MDLDPIPTPKQLQGAAGVARTLAYVVGASGVLTGMWIYGTEGQVALALLVWVVTFAAGALLMILAFLTTALSALLARTAMMEQDLRTLLGRRSAGRHEPAPDEHDPWSGGHPNPW